MLHSALMLLLSSPRSRTDKMRPRPSQGAAIVPAVDSDHEAKATANPGLHPRYGVFNHGCPPGQYAKSCSRLQEHRRIGLAGEPLPHEVFAIHFGVEQVKNACISQNNLGIAAG